MLLPQPAAELHFKFYTTGAKHQTIFVAKGTTLIDQSYCIYPRCVRFLTRPKKPIGVSARMAVRKESTEKTAANTTETTLDHNHRTINLLNTASVYS